MLVVIGAAQSVLGFIAGFPQIATRNVEEIPLWAPLGLALAFVLISALSWSRQLAPRLLAAFWALSGACFARAGLQAAGWQWLALELPAVALAALCALFTGRKATFWLARVACGSTAVAPVLVALALQLPPDPRVDAAVYPLVLLLALPSAALGVLLKRQNP